MKRFFFPPRTGLKEIHTQLGARSVQDSIAFCNRCGCCSQACPTYRATQNEAFSPRGRNQLARLLAEGKLSPAAHRKLIREAVSSCSFCGACTAACAGKIPTAEHMLELRRALNLRLLPRLLHKLLSLRDTSPRLFNGLIRTGRLLRAAGTVKLARALRLTRLPFLQWVNYADDILPARIVPFQRRLKRLRYAAPEKPGVIYMPSLEAEYLDTQIAEDSLRMLSSKNPLVWAGQPCGLFAYLYGDLRQARKTARALIRRYEQAGKKLPLVTDSIDAYTMLMRFPQLFAGNTFWQQKARTLIQNVRFIGEYFFIKSAGTRTPLRRVRLEETSLLGVPQQPADGARKILKTIFKKNLVEYEYNEPAAPAAGYGFVNPVRAREAFVAKMKDTARAQVKTVFTLSGLSALELDFYLKKHYPCSKAQHLTRLNG